MTKTTKKLVDTLEELPEEEQEDAAAFLLEELKAEQRWAELFAESQEQLSRLADEAIEEFENGETEPMENSLRSDGLRRATRSTTCRTTGILNRRASMRC
jgi:hypothetical protein